MANFFETVLTVLKSDQRFVAEDGTFLRNSLIFMMMNDVHKYVVYQKRVLERM